MISIEIGEIANDFYIRIGKSFEITGIAIHSNFTSDKRNKVNRAKDEDFLEVIDDNYSLFACLI